MELNYRGDNFPKTSPLDSPDLNIYSTLNLAIWSLNVNATIYKVVKDLSKLLIST